jgi:hypothetical protein
MFSVKCTFKMFYFCRIIVSQNRCREKSLDFSPVWDTMSTIRIGPVDKFSMECSATWSIPSVNLSDQCLVVRRRHSRLTAPMFKSTSSVDDPFCNLQSSRFTFGSLLKIVGFTRVEFSMGNSKDQASLWIIHYSYNFTIFLENRRYTEIPRYGTLVDFFRKTCYISYGSSLKHSFGEPL